jgi:hypothetical protein
LALNLKSIAVLKAIVAGKTLVEAGEVVNVGTGRARELLFKICREFRLPYVVSEIKSNPKPYLEKLDNLPENLLIGLRSQLVEDLVNVLKVKNLSELSPKYISNISASQLLESGLTLVAVGELQAWLVGHQLSLKRSPPQSNAEIKAVKHAIEILDAFHFDTKLVRKQLGILLTSK